MYIRRTTLLLALLFATSIIFAQTYANNISTSNNYGAEAVFTSKSVSKKTIKSSVKTTRFYKRLSGTFSGYAIELAASDLPLTRNNKVLRRYGNVHYDKLREGGYSYIIKTQFSSKNALKKFYETVILPHNVASKMIEYKLGKRHIL